TQLVVNLVDNAIKYTPPRGRVTLSCERRDGWAILQVADTGEGIAAEHLPHLFERFYRADSARSRRAGGVGLGLSICRWIAGAHGGELSVSSPPGIGSRFTLRVPAAGAQRPLTACPAPPRQRANGRARRTDLNRGLTGRPHAARADRWMGLLHAP